MATTPQKSNTRSRKPAGSTRAKPRSAAAGSRSSSASTRARSNSAQRAASANGQGAAGTARKAIAKVGKPVVAGGVAVAGIVGGIALGAKAMPRKRRFPSSLMHGLNGLDMKKLDPGKIDMKKTRKQVGKASKQFGEFTKELRKAGEQAERIGEALK
jgi:hypothetical protein